MNEVSNLFVCLMGMGTTFVGLICIIFLTMLMGKVMQKLEKPEDIANMEKMLDLFEEDDDVQNVWHNWDQEE